MSQNMQSLYHPIEFRFMIILGPHTWDLTLDVLELGYMGIDSDGLDVVLCS